jgi:hypothetical protein
VKRYRFAGSDETSLRLPLSALGNAGLLGALVFYAGNPGAFVDLAADLSFALGLGPDVVALDQDLTPISDPAGLTGLTGLAEMSQVNQAIGILIERGHVPHSARTELHRLANLAQTTPPAAAQQLMHTARASGVGADMKYRTPRRRNLLPPWAGRQSRCTAARQPVSVGCRLATTGPNSVCAERDCSCATM